MPTEKPTLLRPGSIHVDRLYPHPRPLVWRALTDSKLLGQWLMPNDFRAEVGHRFTFQTEPGPGFDGVIHCVVLEVQEEARLVFEWVGGPVDTVVSFDLQETPEGTRLRMSQTGFRGLAARLVQRILSVGSRKMYGKHLPALLDRLAGGEGSDLNAAAAPACMTKEQGLIQRILTRLF